MALLATAILGLTAGSVVIEDLRTGAARDLVRTVAASLALMGVFYELLWRPEVRVTADCAVLVNPIRTLFIPWSLVEGTAVAWGLRLITRDHRYRCWAAVSGSGAGQSWSTGRGIEGDYSSGLGFPTSMGSDASPTLRNVLQGMPGAGLSGAAQAKVLVDEAWQAWQGRRPGQGSEPGAVGVVTSWHWRSIAFIVGSSGVVILSSLAA